jgi:uncharacterized protein with HEPN domain
MQPKELIYLQYIIECIDALLGYANEVGSFEALRKSPLYEDAVLRRIHVMAESMLRLEETSKADMPEIPWRAIKNFRNLIVHQYFEVDMDKVWHLIHNDLPVLKTAIKRIMEKKYGEA